MKTATKRTLTRADWIFLKDDECPREELQACYEYEMAREAVLAGLVQSKRHADWTWKGCVRVLGYFKQWPKTPWLAITPDIRKKRLAAYLKDVADTDADWRKRTGWNAVEGNVERLRDEQGTYHNRTTFFRGELDFRYGDEGIVTTYFVHRVNWELANKKLLERFEAWLNRGRKWIEKNRGQKVRVRAPWKETSAFERLKRLGVKRLMEAYGFHEANKLVMLENCQPYPGGQVAWNHAAKDSKNDFDAFLINTPFWED